MNFCRRFLLETDFPCLPFLLVFLFTLPLVAGEQIGARPYEMVDAGRTRDAHSPLVDFENLDGWVVETVESDANFTVSREQQLWGDHVGKLTYKYIPAEKKTPVVTLKPPKPIPISKPFDCVNVWIYGNNWPRPVPDPTTPQVVVTAVFQGSMKQPLRLELCKVNWKEWFLVHKKFSAAQLAVLGDSPMFEAFEIRGGTNTELRNLFFDNLSFFKEELPPLSFEPRPLRNIKLPKGQTTGTNTGPGVLPFPNREETILPTCLTKKYRNTRGTDDYSFDYEADDGKLSWLYAPKTGTLDDLTVTWKGASGLSQSFRIANSGPKFNGEKQEPALREIEWQGDTLAARWRFGANEIEYRFTMKQKSLIVDVRCLGGVLNVFSSGGWSGLSEAKLVKIPYLTGNGGLRPAVIVTGSETNPLFVLSTLDHTRSNASAFFWENKTEKDFVSAAACCRYVPKTDGRLNDCFERLFITVSPVFEEVLPNIPNDPSPWKHVTAERVWRTHGTTNHDSDYEYWIRVKRYGMEKILVTDHETVWRDGYESFTLRTTAPPGRGGDKALMERTRKMHELGFVYGPYNNYCDFATVNEFWNPDWVARRSDGNYHPAWFRCYSLKPAVAVQMEPKITEIIQRKFNFNTAYFDVHTSRTPWSYVDYDARVPGAGTFAATYYAYGEMMLHQKKIWNGPVSSEGPNHWYYSGLTDGNYAQDNAYFVREKGLPWIVDFDLLKIHPLENNFGMGGPVMFYGPEQFRNVKENAKEKAEESGHGPDRFLAASLADSAVEFTRQGPALDRFLAATLAFGHTGYFAYGQLGNIFADFDLDHGVRSYFAIQQLAARYGTQNVKTIRYADGKYLTASQAIASDAVKLNRIKVEYEDGLTIYVNGNIDAPWKCYDEAKHLADIPPNGWYLVDPTGKLTAWSLDRDGCRTDYVDSPKYLFAEIRDNPKGKPRQFDRLLCDRQLIVRKNIDASGRWEMIVGEPDYAGRSTLHAVRLDGDADVIALDFQHKELGTAKTRYSHGMVHVVPVDGAFSYLLTPKAK